MLQSAWIRALAHAHGWTINGGQFCKSDGTSAGTVPLSPASLSTFIGLTNVNGTLFFSAKDGVHGNELWKSDGTVAATAMVQDVNPGRNGGTTSL